MATITADVSGRYPADKSDEAMLFKLHTWVLGQNDIGEPMGCVTYADRMVQATGVFDGGEVIVEGSLCGEHFFPLRDLDGNEVRLTGPSFRSIRERAMYVRPRMTKGKPATSVTVRLLAARQP